MHTAAGQTPSTGLGRLHLEAGLCLTPHGTHRHAAGLSRAASSLTRTAASPPSILNGKNTILCRTGTGWAAEHTVCPTSLHQTNPPRSGLAHRQGWVQAACQLCCSSSDAKPGTCPDKPCCSAPSLRPEQTQQLEWKNTSFPRAAIHSHQRVCSHAL